MQRTKEAVKASDGNLLGDPGRIPLSKRESIKWQRPRFTRQALMRCCLIKWILSSAAPQGSAVTVNWSYPRCAISQRAWTSYKLRPSSPRRSCSPFTEASRMSVPQAWWMKTPSNSFIPSSSLREMPPPMHTSSSMPSMLMGTGPSTLRTLWLGSPSCFEGRSMRSSSGPSISMTLTRMVASPRRRCWPS
uniref:Isoform 2 of Calsenilin n=1 Tax=Mus musculus TaxID=10090 RepID=Q9QXT8-2|nr:calsenilin/KChIP3 T- variant [Mus musculus]